MKNSLIISSAALFMVFGIALPAHTQDQQTEKKDKQEQKRETKKEAKPDQRAQQPQEHDRQRQPVQQPRQTQERPQQREQEGQDRRTQDSKQNEDRQHQQDQRQQQERGREQEQRIQQIQNQERQQQQGQAQQQRQDEDRQQGFGGHPDHDVQRDSPQRLRREGNPEQQRAWQSTWQNHRARSWQSDHRSWQQRGGYNGYRIPEDRYRGYFGPEHSFRISGQPFAVYDGYPRFQYEGYWITLLDPWPEYWSNDWYDNDDVYVDYRDDGYYMYDRRYPNIAIAISISM